jgi:alkylhydroperoxidase family enzyme
MAKPAHYTSKVEIPLPSDETVRRIIGKSYSPEKTLNVIKMFAGTEDMFEATIGLVKAIFQTQGIDPKLRKMIILRAATVLDAPYEWQANTQMAKNAGLSLRRSTRREAKARWPASTPNMFWCARRPTNCRRAALCVTRR